MTVGAGAKAPALHADWASAPASVVEVHRLAARNENATHALDQKIPLIANVLHSNPSGEGWALYSEALAKEMGLYATACPACRRLRCR